MPEQNLGELLETLPAMIGGEYITSRLLSTLWSDLTLSFAKEIKQFSGSVTEFIHRYAPNSHLLGRVYFHLVENKDPDAPFAFLATYSTRMGGDGQSKHLPLKYALQEIFMVQGEGLFPTPAEITFDCSCPDWASMCKHVAATLYGIGARLDEDPALFFTLRQADIDDLVSQAVQSKTAAIMNQLPAGGSKVITDEKLSDLFGLDMDDLDFPKPVKKKKSRAKKRVPKSSPKSEKSVKSKTAAQEQNNSQKFPTAIAQVAHYINKSKAGLSIKDLQRITGFPARKLYGILFRLKQQEKVLNPDHGIYSRIEP